MKKLLFNSVLTVASSAAKTKPSNTFGFNPCSDSTCGNPAVRPLVNTGAMVFLSCSESWESTEQSAGTTMLLEIWWGVPPVSAYLNNQEKTKQSHICKTHARVFDVVFIFPQKAVLYWTQTLIYSRKWDIFAKCVKLLEPTDNSSSQEELSVCL